MEDVSMIDGLSDKIFSEYGLLVVLLIVAIGWIARQWVKAMDRKDEVTNMYHNDSKNFTIAINALTEAQRDSNRK